MLPPVNPTVLKGNSQHAFNKIGAIFSHELPPKVLAADTGKNYVFVARYVTDSPNLHFHVYNKNFKMTDKFILTGGNGDAGVGVQTYSAFQNNVMRKRDIAVSPDKDMSFEQILQTRPVIVKRIQSLLSAASEALGKRH